MNTKWDSVVIGNFTNSGHYDFTMNILAAAKQCAAVVEKCGPELAAMEAAVREEDEALLHAQKSPYTKELWAKDEVRDRRYYNVSELTRAMTKWPEEMAQKAAADRVMATLDTYKVNPQAQVNKETGAMTNLLQELQGELAADIATLGLTEIVAQMAEANEEVNRIYNDRLWADSVKVTGRVAKARAEVDKCYMALREKVNALVIVFGPADYTAFLGYVNERIAKANRWQLSGKKGAGSSSGSGSESEEEEEVEEEVTEEETGEEGGTPGNGGSGSDNNGSDNTGSGSSGLGSNGNGTGNNPGSGSGTGIPIQPGPGGDDPDL